MGWVSGGASEAGPSDGLLRDILSNVDGVKPELDSIQRKLTKFVSFSATTSSEIRTLQGGTVGLCEFAVGFARCRDDITLNLHRLKWHGRQLELILKGVSCRATDHPARVVLTTLQNAGLAREVPIRYARIEAARGSAGSTPGPAGSKATVFFCAGVSKGRRPWPGRARLPPAGAPCHLAAQQPPSRALPGRCLLLGRSSRGPRARAARRGTQQGGEARGVPREG